MRDEGGDGGFDGDGASVASNAVRNGVGGAPGPASVGSASVGSAAADSASHSAAAGPVGVAGGGNSLKEWWRGLSCDAKVKGFWAVFTVLLVGVAVPLIVGNKREEPFAPGFVGDACERHGDCESRYCVADEGRCGCRGDGDCDFGEVIFSVCDADTAECSDVVPTTTSTPRSRPSSPPSAAVSFGPTTTSTLRSRPSSTPSAAVSFGPPSDNAGVRQPSQDTPSAQSEVCTVDKDCPGGKCAYASMDPSSPAVCCASGSSMSIFVNNDDGWPTGWNRDFCTNQPDGAPCRGTEEEICEGGACVGGKCANEKLHDHEVCAMDNDCAGGKCAYASMNPSSSTVCCASGSSMSIFVNNDDGWPTGWNRDFCTNQPDGAPCRGTEEELCESGTCVGDVCVGLDIGDVCEKNTDCFRGACAYATLYASSHTVCCASGSSIWVAVGSAYGWPTVGGRYFCTGQPDGTSCGGIDAICESNSCAGEKGQQKCVGARNSSSAVQDPSPEPPVPQHRPSSPSSGAHTTRILVPSEDVVFHTSAKTAAIHGGTAIVGAPNNEKHQGVAFVFVRDETGAWVQQTKLVAPERSNFDLFGWCVDVYADTAVVGMHGDDDGTPFNAGRSGSAHVFVRTGNTWSHQAKLASPDEAEDYEFGRSVGIFEDTIVVGSQYDDGNGEKSGSAHVFVRNGDGTWSYKQKLVAPDGDKGDEFGHDVTIHGNTIAIGAPKDDDSELGDDSGSVHIFVQSAEAGIWYNQAKLVPPSSAAHSQFGWSLGLYEDTIVVGERCSDDKGNQSGSAHIFIREATTWTPQTKLLASDGGSFDLFGYSIGIYGGAIVIGAKGEGSAYLFSQQESAWSEQTKISPSGGATCVDVYGDLVIVGSCHAGQCSQSVAEFIE